MEQLQLLRRRRMSSVVEEVRTGEEGVLLGRGH